MILRKIADRWKMLIRVFIPAPVSLQQSRVIPWFKINGDKTLRLDYELHTHSLVFDLGGYEGQWASDIYAKYRCKIFVFEPHLPYAQNIKDRFRLNGDLTIFDFGLSSKTTEVSLSISDDASSIYKPGERSSIIKLEDAVSFFQSHKIKEVDLMKVNIEGGEFELIDYLIETGLITKVKNLQVQFHDFVPDAYAWRKRIQEKLMQTHSQTYNFDFVWENWRLKE
ncbi:MAG: hypothetical protein DI538_05175 [Azospira oryzae]|jgi:FkbM family methyltransferase|nr:MAG: hypothetical protein DI538_05175 [Azospira oryzae]